MSWIVRVPNRQCRERDSMPKGLMCWGDGRRQFVTFFQACTRVASENESQYEQNCAYIYRALYLCERSKPFCVDHDFFISGHEDSLLEICRDLCFFKLLEVQSRKTVLKRPLQRINHLTARHFWGSFTAGANACVNNQMKRAHPMVDLVQGLSNKWLIKITHGWFGPEWIMAPPFRGQAVEPMSGFPKLFGRAPRLVVLYTERLTSTGAQQEKSFKNE